MTRGRGRRLAVMPAVAMVVVAVAGTVSWLGLATGARAAATSRGGAEGPGVVVVVGCVAAAQDLSGGRAAAERAEPADAGGRCGVLVVVCGDDGRIVTSVTLVQLSGSGHGELVVRLGAACPGPRGTPTATPTATSTATSPPTVPPPTSLPPSTPPPVSPTAPSEPPPASGPTATGSPSPAPGGATTGPGGGPAGVTGASPSQAAAGVPTPQRPVSPSARGATTPASAVPGPPTSPPFAATAPTAPPFDSARTDDATRWWLLSVLCVLLPAALAAAYPRGTGRRS